MGDMDGTSFVPVNMRGGSGSGDSVVDGDCTAPIEARELRQDQQRRFQLRLPATAAHVNARLLHGASMLVRSLGDVGCVRLFGPFWRDGEDEFVLDVFVEDVQTEPDLASLFAKPPEGS